MSPAFDLNPSNDKAGLALNIDTTGNTLDFELAKSVGEYFHLSLPEMDAILGQVRRSVLTWKSLAAKTGIGRNEMQIMEVAFRFIS